MDRVGPDHQYSQSDPSAAAQYSSHPEVRETKYYPPATPTTDYSAAPTSARSANFPPDYLARQSHYASNSGAASMAQATNPSIAASSPTYPNPYSPYGPPSHDMSQYPGHPPPNYGHWPGYGHPHGLPYSSPGGAGSGAGSPATAGPQRPGQVYSFVPIPGAQQHKRPRRRYEEIERMYKCGHQGCEKAYGTLNHLNAHVTMQSHGVKRTPEEFKEIRKEWKARKKEEETARKQEEERARASMGGSAPQGDGPAPDAVSPPTASNYSAGRGPQLPPIGYSAAGGQMAGQYAGGADPMYPQSNGQMYSTYPHSPYGAQNGQVYSQHPETSGSYAS